MIRTDVDVETTSGGLDVHACATQSLESSATPQDSSRLGTHTSRGEDVRAARIVLVPSGGDESVGVEKLGRDDGGPVSNGCRWRGDAYRVVRKLSRCKIRPG